MPSVLRKMGASNIGNTQLVSSSIPCTSMYVVSGVTLIKWPVEVISGSPRELANSSQPALLDCPEVGQP